jgi:hypothetical protein
MMRKVTMAGKKGAKHGNGKGDGLKQPQQDKRTHGKVQVKQERNPPKKEIQLKRDETQSSRE